MTDQPAHPLPPEALAALDAAGYVVITKQALHDARHTVNGRCRYCNGITNPDLHPGRQAVHEMRCRFYVGPLEHRWVRTGWNGTFGGVDHHCVCGGWFRLGGIAGHGDGTENAIPVCPHANETYRGDQ